MRNTTLNAKLARVPVALALVLGIVLHEIPAQAAGPDVGEASRRFVAAVKSSDRDVALAEAALEDAIGKAAVLTSAEARRSREAMSRLLTELRKFKAEKARLLSDLGTYEKLLRAAAGYARACEVLGTVIRVEIAVIVVVVGVVVTVATGGTALVAVAAVTVAVAAVVVCVTTILASLSEVLRAFGFREAGDTAGRWMKDNPWFGTTLTVINVVAAVLSNVAAATVALRAADATARDAKARLEAAPKPAVPAPPARKQMEIAPPPATFDGDFGGSFHVKLENGQATRPAGQAVLRGTIAITSTSNANVKLTLAGDATLTAGGGGGWVSLRGHGTARLSGFGPVLTIPNATVASQGVSVFTLLGDGIPVRGCTHTVDAGSLFSSTRMSLAGSLRCGPWTLTASTMALSGGGVSGGGTLSAWSKSFTMGYAPSGDGLVARGSISGSDTPWTGIPRVDAEYRIERPKLDVKLEGPSLSPTFGAGRILVRSKATKPDGSPWSSATLTPDVMRVPAPPAGPVPVPFPNLPPPGDVFKAARDTCEAAARKALFGQARDRALEACRSTNPSPPGMPALPNRLDVPVGDIFR